MSKRDVVRGMYDRAVEGESSESYAISYLARRINLTVEKAKSFVRWMSKNGGCPSYMIGQTVVFVTE
jgi:hypothetical protein